MISRTHEVPNLIGGERVGAADGATFERRNPADARQVVSVAPESTAADVTDAVSAAVDALRTWRTTSPTARSNVLSAAARLLAARADDLAAEMVSEEGKPLADARNEASRTPKNLELYAGEAYRLFGATFPSDDTPLVYSVLDPVGVVAVITPWNFPLNLASRKIGPALAAGNAVVFKPSPMTPLMGARLADAFVEAGLPPGVLNVVHGFDAGAHLVADTRVDAVTFTGSTAVGHKIHAASRLGQRLQLELGGKNPVVVLADADIQAAADVVARSSFSLTGQACTGAGRILVEAAVYEELVEAVTERAAGHVLGAGDRDGVTMGPLVDDRALGAMDAAVSTATDDGAKVVAGERGRRAKDSTTAGSTHRPCWPTPGPTWRSPAARCSVPSSASSASAPWTRRSPRPTMSSTGSRRRSARDHFRQPSTSPQRSRPAWCASTGRRWAPPSTLRSVGSSSPERRRTGSSSARP